MNERLDIYSMFKRILSFFLTLISGILYAGIILFLFLSLAYACVILAAVIHKEEWNSFPKIILNLLPLFAGMCGITAIIAFILILTKEYLHWLFMGKSSISRSSVSAAPGDTIDCVIYHNKAYMAKKLKVNFLGEETKITDHENNFKSRKHFHKETLIEQSNINIITGNSIAKVTLQIPEDAPYSMQNGDFGIEWNLEIILRRRFIPAKKETFIIRVKPKTGSED